jgi:PTH1 family peptidyl-tRNA hydrolase
MPDKRTWLIAGLGNPGRDYRDTRHNLGFRVLEQVASAYSIPINKSKFQTQYGRGSIEGVKAILAQPLAFMNKSGPPVRSLADFFKIPGRDLLVIHDDLDLAFGRIKIKEKGGHGGHNGLRSLMSAFGGGDFARLRIGIGRPVDERSVTDHVLSRHTIEEDEMLGQILDRAQKAVEVILTKGLTVGMNRFNDRQLLI